MLEIEVFGVLHLRFQIALFPRHDVKTEVWIRADRKIHFGDEDRLGIGNRLRGPYRRHGQRQAQTQQQWPPPRMARRIAPDVIPPCAESNLSAPLPRWTGTFSPCP